MDSQQHSPGREGVVVVGGANLDIRARCTEPVVARTSNPGVSTTRPGGVGRNIAENLARLGSQVTLLTPLGRDAFGAQLRAHAEQAGIELVALGSVSGRTGSYLALLDADGEMVAAVSDMAITDALTPEHLEPLPSILPTARLVVLDANVPPDAASFVLDAAAEHGVPVLVELVSVAKAARLAPAISRRPVLAISANLPELSALLGRQVNDQPADIAAAAAGLTDGPVQHVWVHRGPNPSVLCSRSQDHWDEIAPPPVPVIDVTGGGDAMAAGFAFAILRGDDPASAATFGQMLGALTVATPDTVVQGLRPGLVESALAGADLSRAADAGADTLPADATDTDDRIDVADDEDET
ncbi:MAG: carbohydrate kinase family protein [Actinomycetales bacterium]